MSVQHGIDAQLDTQQASRASSVSLSLGMRAIRIVVISIWNGVAISASAVALRVVRGRKEGSRRFYRGVVRYIEQLGPTFIKFAQIASSRRDVLPLDFCEALAILHDRVPPMTEKETRRALHEAYGNALTVPLFRFEDLELLASGSIASVYRAISHTGIEVALKVRRPSIHRVMIDDLGLMEKMVRIAEYLPKCKGMPLGDLVAYISTAILGQLDFEREAKNLALLRRGVASFSGVNVPSPMMDLCGPGCLAMEFIPGLNASTLDTLSPDKRAYLADTALMVVGHLMFMEGFSHCDLHPGNLYATETGDLVILDAGFTVVMPEGVRLLMGEFFYCMMTRKGRRCAEIIIESAANVRTDRDLSGFIDSVSELVDKQSHASFFSMAAFGNEIFELQQKFGLYAQSDFAFPMMSLAVLEGTLRQINPTIDFQRLGQASDTASVTAITRPSSI